MSAPGSPHATATGGHGHRRLAGRRILVTGAGSGIGLAAATLFVQEGARVALLDLNVERARPLAERAQGVALEVDVGDEQAVQTAVRLAAERLGGLDGVVNAAGVIAVGSLEQTDLATWRRQLDINLTGPYLVCRAALPWLRAAPGATIVNIASAQALRPTANSCAYAASKAGVLNFTKAIAAELAPAIRVNAVCPGIVDTPMVAQVQKTTQGTGPTPTLKDYPLGRMARPDEIAAAILFLTSAESSFVTGSAFAVDGGRSLH